MCECVFKDAECDVCHQKINRISTKKKVSKRIFNTQMLSNFNVNFDSSQQMSAKILVGKGTKWFDESNILFTLELEQTELMKSSYFFQNDFFFQIQIKIQIKRKEIKINALHR